MNDGPAPVERHAHVPDVSFDGGDLDCGGGLLLLIRQHLDPLPRGGLLEIRSTETSVDVELPAWCRLTENTLVSWTKAGRQRSFLVCRGTLAERAAAARAAPRVSTARPRLVPVTIPAALPAPAPAPGLPRLAVMGIGSWPRPRWMVEALHARLEGRLDEAAFEATADDAVRLALAAQERAGADCVTDGEQRRDSYASFIGGRLDNCQLVPLTDLLPLVDDPDGLAAEFRALDVPAADVRHPVAFGPLGRSRPIAAHELAFARGCTTRPLKVALPGPYVSTRTLWLECLRERAYPSRAALAADVVRVLREEVAHLLAGGAALVQLDEPVLTEVVHGAASGSRTFMCGALSGKEEVPAELAFARDLINGVCRGLPRDRLALHVCRGNWSPDESVALRGDYGPLIATLGALEVGTYCLEAATPRAGDLALLRGLPHDRRVAVGVVNQKDPRVETVDEVVARARRAIDVLGTDRVALVPDCGFATFADNPVCAADIAEQKLAAMAQAAARLR